MQFHGETTKLGQTYRHFRCSAQGVRGLRGVGIHLNGFIGAAPRFKGLCWRGVSGFLFLLVYQTGSYRYMWLWTKVYSTGIVLQDAEEVSFIHSIT